MTPTLTESFARLAALSAAGRLPEGVRVVKHYDSIHVLTPDGEAYTLPTQYNLTIGALMLLVQALEGQGWVFERLGVIGKPDRYWAVLSPSDEIVCKTCFTTDEPAALAACIVAAVEAGGETK